MHESIATLRDAFRGHIGQNSNPPALCGKLASERLYFGDRVFSVAPVYSRAGGHSWFVWDHGQEDDVTGGPVVIRQENTIEAALTGFFGRHGIVESRLKSEA